jgi:hypothetical protein
VPAIVYAAYLQRPAALDALLYECPKSLAVDDCYQHAPFAGWTAFNFTPADRDAVSGAKLAAAGCDTSSAPDGHVGTAWLDALEGLGDNNHSGFVGAFAAAADPHDFLNWRDPAGRTVLHNAAILGSAPLVHLLFELGFKDASPVDLTGDSPLTLAVQHSIPSFTTIRALLDNGATATADHVARAAVSGQARAAALLVGSGAPVPPGVTRRTLKNALAAARELRAAPAASVLRSDVLLCEAIARSNHEAVEFLMATGAHDASRTLPRVAACGSLRMLKTLLAVSGVSVNARLCAPGKGAEGAPL